MTLHVICPNPAMDKLYLLDGFIAGEDYPGLVPTVRFGGKGINAARVLSQLGAQVHLYALMGEESQTGFMREMEPRCTCTWILVPGACRTTVNIVDRSQGKETVLTERGPTASAEQVEALLEAVRQNVQAGEWVACSGSLMGGVPSDFYAQISRICTEKNAHCALDTNAKVLPKALAGARYALGKPNERELCGLLNEPRTQEPKVLATLAGRIMPPYETLLISMGARGGLWVEGALAYEARVPAIPVVSTVGSGDAAFAGAIYAQAMGKSAQETLRLAMACGAANALLGEVGHVRISDVHRLMQDVEIVSVL